MACNTRTAGAEKAVERVTEMSLEPVYLIICEEFSCYSVLMVVEAQGILLFLTAAFVKSGAVKLFKSWAVWLILATTLRN